MTPVLFNPQTDDATALELLHASAFADAWSKSAICDFLAGPGVFAFCTPDGFILARAAGGEAEILTLAVRPVARGQGLGRALLHAAARHAANLGAEVMFLEVGADNPAALALYAGSEFRSVGQRKGYYDGRDALVLRAQLPLSLAGKFA
jgi:ribosomal-protein-alanine N-acetyltransferase